MYVETDTPHGRTLPTHLWVLWDQNTCILTVYNSTDLVFMLEPGREVQPKAIFFFFENRAIRNRIAATYYFDFGPVLG